MFSPILLKSKALSNAQTGTAVWTPASGKAIALFSLEFTTSADAAVSVFVGTEGDTTRIAHGDFKAGSGVAMEFRPIQLAPDAVIKVTTSAGNLKIAMTGTEE